MLFELPEYERSYREFLGESLYALARARSPLLAEIEVERVTGPVGSRILTRDGMDVDLSFDPIGTDHLIDFEDVVRSDFDKLLVDLDRSAERLGEQMSNMLFQGLSKVTAATGNVIDAKGAKFSWDMVLQSLEQVEWGTDEDGNVKPPSLVLHPDMLANAPEPTSEQHAALEELKRQKQAEADARRRYRRLS